MSEEQESGSRFWTVNLYGDFSLRSPAGILVAPNHRKVEALLAMLAVHREHGITRSFAAGELWPGQDSGAQRTNLRQILHLLKGHLGQDSLFTTRDSIRLSSSFPLKTDYPRPIGKLESFMPGHEGAWFDEIRFESTADEEDEDVIGHLASTARWLAREDPAGMLALFRVNCSLTRSIPFSVRLGVLAEAYPGAEPTGWADYWRGSAEDDLETCALLLSRALKRAKETSDFILGAEALLELGKVYARTGAVAQAVRTAQLSMQMASSSPSRLIQFNAARVSGLVNLHSGRSDEGLRLLDESERYLDNDHERRLATSSRAFFEASFGRFEQAAQTLNSLHPTPGTGMLDGLTRTILLAREDRLRAIRELTALSSRLRTSGFTQIGVYADELLAKLYLLERQQDLAAPHVSFARRGRVKARMAVTKSESRRLAVIAS